MDFAETKLADLRDSIARGETSARVAAESSLDAAEKLNETLNAFLEIEVLIHEITRELGGRFINEMPA